MNLLFVVRTLTMGGMESSTVKLANDYASRGHEVKILTLADRPLFYRLDGRVEHVLGEYFEPGGPKKKQVIQWIFDRRRRLLHLRSQFAAIAPDAIISCWGDTNVVCIAAARRLRIPVIVTERAIAANAVAQPYSWLRRFFYPKAARVVVFHASMLNQFSQRIRSKSVVIPSFVELPEEHVDTSGSIQVRPSGFRLIAMGRLAEEKRFADSIRAFATIADEFPDWTFTIYGDGNLRNRLQEQIVELSLQDRIKMPGTTRQPFDEFKKSDAFVLTSMYEGFPNVLCEALASGCPAISYNCPCGPDVILRDGVDGILVENNDFDGLVAAMRRMMGDSSFREACASRAPEILQRYSRKKVMGQWDELLAGVIRNR